MPEIKAPKLSFEVFCQLFKIFQDLSKLESELTKKTQLIFTDDTHPRFHIKGFAEIYKSQILLIENLLEGWETREGIEWFIYENDFGKKFRNSEFQIQLNNGKQYKINNLRQYYNYVYSEKD